MIPGPGFPAHFLLGFVSCASCTPDRGPCLASSTSRPPTQEPETAAATVGRRPSPLGLALAVLGGLEIGASYRETGDGNRMASQRLSALLVFERSPSSR